METSLLENRDYTLIIDKSTSMSTLDQPGEKSRWEIVQESTLALARKCEQFDADGITVYLFSDGFQRFEQVTAEKVAQIFAENTPKGSTNLVSALQDATKNYFQRKKQGQTKTGGETILVVTDGEPNERWSLIDVIIKASQQMQQEQELAISFIQVGSDPKATRFLKSLDEQLESIGAKFDICDTVTLEDMDDKPLAEVLLNAILD